jgi:hypothetical protein
MASLKALVAVFLVALVSLTAPSSVFAQTTAEVVGRVFDSDGAVLPGASVTLENVGTKDVRTTVSNETGDYLFTLLPIGSYTVRIELQGFQAQNAKVQLNSGDRIRVDGKLAVGSLQETVLVTGESPLLQTDTSTLSSLVNEQQMQELPVNGRNFIRLVQLVPGATEGAANSMLSGNRPDDRCITSAVSINGAPDNQNNQMIDGIDNNERGIGTIGIKPSMDAIAEVRVQTNLYSAETGRTAGGIVNILTKSGTNAFHGTAYEFLRNDAFDARDYFATQDPVLDQHQYGGSIGGPIVSNRTFFFGDYENLTNTRGLVQTLTLPTAKMRTGDFSELSTQIFDPTTSPRQPFPGNIIPANRLDPVSVKYMAILPANTNSALANNYQRTAIAEMDSHTADGRIDHRFNTNNSIFARFSYNNVDTVQPGGCPTMDTGPYAGISPVCRGGENGFPGPNHTTASAYQANYVRVFSPTLIGEFKGGFVRLNINTYPTNYLTNASTTFGLPNVNLDDIANGGGLASVTLTGYTSLGDSGFNPLLSHGNTQHYQAALTKTMGAHSFKFGGGAILREFGVVKSPSPVGTFTFNQNLTRGSANQGGHTMASFMLGYMTSVQRVHSPFEPSLWVPEPNFYVQDDWRTTSWLTINLGLRYDIYYPYQEAENRLSNFEILGVTTPRILPAGEGDVNRYANIKTNYDNIQPRLGFAATMPAQTVIRGGYGITYFPMNIASPFDMKNPPVVPTYGPVTSLGDTGGAPTLFFKDGLPPFSTERPSIALQDLRGNIAAVDLDYKSTRMHQFNLLVEKELAGNVVTAGYVGARGQRVNASQNQNLAPLGTGNVQARRPYNSIMPGVPAINVQRSMLDNQYDAFQLQFQRRLSHGLSVNAHARWSHGTEQQLLGWDQFSIEEREVSQDIGHSYVLQANYALPWGNDLTGVSKAVLGGWQINAIANWQGGTAFGVTNSSERGGTGGSDRPNQIADPVLPKDERTVERWFNTAAFVQQPLGTVGNAPNTGDLWGPPQRRLDLSFFKDFAMPKNSTLQFRYEIYNIFNVANFQNPASAIGNATFGTLSSTGNSVPRQMQFALKYLF